MKKLGLGWLRDLPDIRDYTMEHEKIKPLIEKLAFARLEKTTLPDSVDLRAWCSSVEDQLSIGSCTANAGVGLVEYFERKSFGKHIDASSTSRNKFWWVGAA